jgi:phosphoribosylformylglycinamidine synthase
VKISVPPTLLVSALGQIDDVRRAVTLELAEAGDAVYLIGITRDETGGSEYFRWLGARDGAEAPLGSPRPYVGSKVPRLRTEETLPLYRALAQATREGLVASAATPSRGGWAACFARSAMAGGLGLDLDVAACEDLAGLAPDVALFAESAGRFLVTAAPGDATRLERCFAGLPCRRVGRVTVEPRLVVRRGREAWLAVDLAELEAAFATGLADE